MSFRYSKKDRSFISALVLVHAVFFLLALHYTRIYMGDSYEYIYEAMNIKNLFFFYSGNPAMPIQPEYMTQRQPLYPLFLSGVYLFSVNNWIVLVLQNLISIGNIVYARKLFLHLGFNRRYDWLLLLLVIASPSQFINANTIAPDILLQSFTLLYFGQFIALYKTRNLRHGWYMCLWLIAGLFVKPVLYPFVSIHFLTLFILFLRWNIKMQRPLLIMSLPVCVVLCYNYSNELRTGKSHFSSNQSFNAIYYFNAYYTATQGADSAAKFLANERADIDAFPEYKDRYDYANNRGIALLKEHFAPYMLFHLKSAGRIFIDPGKAEMDLFTGHLTYGGLYSKQSTGLATTMKEKGISGLGSYLSANRSMIFIIPILLFNLLRLCGMVLFFFDRSINKHIRLSALLLLLYFAVIAGPIANTRYFLPVSLIAIGCATIGISSTLQKRLQVK
ncbi:ArnT family glycosyltransferase [Flavipsychrobacter stenotrophus]|uniref:ArnT family glycosyltransferase n=1 Tax=Flavipsychrobacter stenotrophus TaxID=2077091 RepID=UPI001056F5B5|nr:hypothetical protein [Flavipsychrobacter stenotrophus]